MPVLKENSFEKMCLENYVDNLDIAMPCTSGMFWFAVCCCILFVVIGGGVVGCHCAARNGMLPPRLAKVFGASNAEEIEDDAEEQKPELSTRSRDKTRIFSEEQQRKEKEIN